MFLSRDQKHFHIANTNSIVTFFPFYIWNRKIFSASFIKHSRYVLDAMHAMLITCNVNHMQM